MAQPHAVSELLQQLHTALADAPSMSEKDRALLKQLSTDIQGILARPAGTTTPENTSLVAQLGDAITRFEVSHPDVTGVLARVSKALGDMGI